jgi:hypothetical protein
MVHPPQVHTASVTLIYALDLAVEAQQGRDEARAEADPVSRVILLRQALLEPHDLGAGEPFVRLGSRRCG